MTSLSTNNSTALNVNPLEQIERERDDQEKKLKKMEQEMEQVFEMKVKEKKKKLKDSEAEVIEGVPGWRGVNVEVLVKYRC